MKKVGPGTLSKKFKKSFYIKMILLYSLFTIVIVLASFYLSSNLFSKGMEKEIRESNSRSLTQIQISIDKNLLEKVNSINNEKFLDSSNDSILPDFFKSTRTLDSDILLNSYLSISNILVNVEYFSSISLYRKPNDTFVSTGTGVKYNFFSDENNFNIPDKIAINRIKSSSQSRMWISPYENRSVFSDKPTITYVQAIPLYTSFDKGNGCIIFNINHDVLFNSIKKIYGHNGDLMLIDEGGKLFAHSDSSKLYEKLESTDYLEAVMQADTGFVTTLIDNKSYGVSWTKSSINRWKYISIVSMNVLNKQALALRKIILVFIAIVLLVSFIGVNIITSRLYRPLKLLTRKVTDNYKFENKGENELNYIQNVFSYLSGKVDDMEDTLRNNQEVIRYKTIIDILYGNTISPEEIKSRMEMSNIFLDLSLYSIIITEIDTSLFSKLSAKQREYLSSNIIELIDAYFLDKCNCISICHPSDCIVTILNYISSDSTILCFVNLLKYLENSTGINFNIAAGREVNDIILLDKNYSAVGKYLKYKYIYGFNNIFTYSTIERYESKSGDIDSNIIIHMEGFLKSSKLEKFKDLLSEQITAIRINGYSYAHTQNFLMLVIGIISKACRNQNITSAELEKSKIISDFYRNSTLDECIQWINYILEVYGESISLRKLTIDTKFIEKISQYISENIEKSISLNSIAEEFGISPSYLSRIFKEGTNIHLSDFILQKRLEKAAELIISNSSKTISKIGEELGYYTPAYFAKIFKEKYGITPALYRKRHLSDNPLYKL